METQVAVLQTQLTHLNEGVKDLKTSQDKTNSSVEKMTEKLDTAFVTREDFNKFMAEIFNPVKKKVDNLMWNLALLVGGGGVLITLINWYLLFRQKQ